MFTKRSESNGRIILTSQIARQISASTSNKKHQIPRHGNMISHSKLMMQYIANENQENEIVFIIASK